MKNSNLDAILKQIKEQEIKFFSFRFSDLEGKWHQITKCFNASSKKDLEEVITFDGSSIHGWRGIENSDMILKPDYSTFFVDPFCVQNTAVIICDVYDTLSNKPYTHDPRSIATKAEEYFKKTGIGDEVCFGPEPEFFIFDDIKFKTSPAECSFKLSGGEMDEASNLTIEGGNFGHRVGRKGGYNAVAPMDSFFDIRNEMITILQEVGIEANLQHHEVAANQCEIGFKFSTLVGTADNIQKFKYVVKNVAASFGKTATFMPKPVYGDNGSGMHVHQSIWKNGKNLFAGKGYAGLSDNALYYIGGIMEHAEALAAFSNPTINSYKRLLPGYEAPTMMAYSACNRSASIRIPYSEGENAKRIETRFPDPSANSYLLCASLLMAGLDGIKKKIHPGEARDQNLYKNHDVSIKRIPHSLEKALLHLEKEHEFLLEGGVFTKEFIHAYIEVKRAELEEFNKIPHPLEFKLYYGI